MNFFSNIIKNINERWNLFKNLNVGDLVWAKMPLNKKKLKTIEESHRIRPYLIIYKDFLNLYAYQASSKKSNRLNNYQIYGINRLRYRKSKDTWIELDNVYKIPIMNLRSKFNSLNLMDLRAIEKRLHIQKNRNNKIKYTFGEKIFISDGDVIVTNKGMFYVYASDNSYVYGFRLPKKRTGIIVTINKKKYFADIKDKIVIKRDMKVQVLDIASLKEIDAINDIRSTLKSSKKVKEKAKMKYEVGTIFQAGKNKIVYLFENDNIYYGVDPLMYQLFPRILTIYNIDEKQIVDIYDNEKIRKIAEFLLINKINPYNKIKEIYDGINEKSLITKP